MTFNYNNHKINYEIIGNGKPVVIIHGLRADLTLMKACLEPVFSRRGGYKRIYIDLPGKETQTHLWSWPRQTPYSTSSSAL